MIVTWILLSVVYREAKVKVQKERNEEKNSLSENTEGKHKLVHQKEDSREHLPT